jgi:hypothetical protein
MDECPFAEIESLRLMVEIDDAVLREALDAIEDRLSGMSGDPLKPLADRIVAHLSRKKP